MTKPPALRGTVADGSGKPRTPRRGAGSLILEQRILLDAAAVATAVDVAAQTDGESLSDLLQDDAASPLMRDFVAEKPVTEAIRSVVIIDTGIQDWQSIRDSFAGDSSVSVHLIDAAEDGVAAMARVLADYRNLDSVRVISHGEDGRIRLGSASLDNQSLFGYRQELAQIGGALAADGDLLLYGCDVVGSSVGRQLVDDLALLTGADIGASVDATGATGDWDLEYRSGDVRDAWAGVAHYAGTLNLDVDFAGTGTKSGTYELGTFIDADGEWVIAGQSASATTGGVVVWRVSGTSRQEYTITMPGTATADFGAGVAISSPTADNATIAVADPGAGINGYVYVYRFNGSGWDLKQGINIDAYTVGSERIGAWAGMATYGGSKFMDIEGRHLVVGAPNENGNTGRIFWFAASDANWSAVSAGATIDEPGGLTSDSDPYYGAAVAIAKDYLVVGAPGADTNGNDGTFGWGDTGNQGRVFVYSWTENSTAAPTEVTNLNGDRDSDGVNGGAAATNGRFGAAVDIEYYNSYYNIVVGAPQENGAAGELYIYQTDTAGAGITAASLGGVTNLYGLGGTNFLANGNLGGSVSVSMGRAVAGAWDNNVSKVYYFERLSGTWSNTDNTNNPSGVTSKVRTFSDTFGSPATAIHTTGAVRMGWASVFTDNMLVVGAPRHGSGAAGQPGGVDFFYIHTVVASGDTLNANEDNPSSSFDILANDVKGTETNTAANTKTEANFKVEILQDTATGRGTFAWNSSAQRLVYTADSSLAGDYDYLDGGQYSPIVASIKYRLTSMDSSVDYVTEATASVRVQGVNDAPRELLPIDKQVVAWKTDGEFYSGSVTIPLSTTFYDPEGHEMTYSLVGAPAWLTLDAANSKLNFNTATTTQLTDYTVTLRATDSKGASKDTTFIFRVDRANNTPTRTVPEAPATNATEDAVYTLDLKAYVTDTNVGQDGLYTNDLNESLTYSIVSQPASAWLGINPDTGILSGVPQNGDVGNNAVTVRATDVFGRYVDTTFTIVVANTNDAPIADVPIERQIATKGSAFSFDITAASAPVDIYFTDIDATNDTISYTAKLQGGRTLGTSVGATGNPGDWLLFNASTGVFSGTSNDSLGAILTIELTANDGKGGLTTTTFEIATFPPNGETESMGSGTAINERLGYSTAVSKDGNWMVVGRPGSNAVLVYKFDGTNWTLKTTLTASESIAGDLFGAAVDVSNTTTGAVVAIGAPGRTALTGKAYIFKSTDNGTTWTAATSPLQVSGTGTATGDRFGTAINLEADGSAVIIGAPQHDAAGNNAGAAFLWDINLSTMALSGERKLLPTQDTGGTNSFVDSRAGDLFGTSVSLDLGLAVIGAPRDDYRDMNGTGLVVDAGSVYVHGKAANEMQKLWRTTPGQTDYLGTSVDLDVFKLTGSTTSSTDSAIVVAGVPGDDYAGANAGAVVVFRSDALDDDANNVINTGVLSSFAQVSTVRAYDASDFTFFGSSVAVHVVGNDLTKGMYMAVGSDQAGGDSGAVYALRYWGAAWNWIGQRYVETSTTAFPAGNTMPGNMLGFSVDIGGDAAYRWISAGAPFADGTVGSAMGAAVRFKLDGTQPIEISPTGMPPPVAPMSLEMPMTEFAAKVGGAGSMSALELSIDSGPESGSGSSESLTDTPAASDTGSGTYSDMLLDDTLVADPLATGGTEGADPLVLQIHQIKSARDQAARVLLQRLEALSA